VLRAKTAAVVVILCFAAAKSRGQSLGEKAQTTVVGCVIAGSGDQKLFADGQHEYVLTAETPALEESLKATDNKQMRLRGFVDDSAGPQPTFEVTQVLGMVERPKPKISPGWADAAKWQTKRNRHYGVEFKHPAESPVVENSQAGVTLEETNFVAADGTIPLGGFPIPRETYPDSNFVGGGFALSVNPEITNRASCEQFGDFDPRSFSTRKIRHVRYTEMESGDAAMGTGYERQYFHTFQNGQCYEFAFEVARFATASADDGCMISELQEEDVTALVAPILERVSFPRAEAKLKAPPRKKMKPNVDSFTASSNAADDLANRGVITVTWSTQGADYVEFSYTCPNPGEVESGGISSLVISEDGPNHYCQNTSSFKTYPSDRMFHSPNSSAKLGFGFFNHDDPTSVIVTITPFANGKAYPAASKSLLFTVNPYDPFPRGVPTETRNMTVSYVPSQSGGQSYAQGSLMTIVWTDARTQDPCVNLYLVRDDLAGGENYLLQINGRREIGCLKPSSNGSYIWTVSAKYEGSNFRILAGTPGGTSSTLGPAFEITAKSTSRQP